MKKYYEKKYLKYYNKYMRQRQKGGGYRSRSDLVLALPKLPKIDTKTGDSLIYQDKQGRWGWYDGKELITDRTVLGEISNKKRKKVIESVRGMQTPEEKDRERQQQIERQRNAEQYNKETIRLKTIEEQMRNTTDATEWDRLNKELSEIDYCSQIQFKNCRGSLRGQSALLEDGEIKRIEIDIQQIQQQLGNSTNPTVSNILENKLKDKQQKLKQLSAFNNPPDGHQQNKMLICERMEELQSSNDTNKTVANKRNKEVIPTIRTDLKTFFDSDHKGFLDRWKAMEAHFGKQLTVDQALNNNDVPGGTDYILTKVLANDGVVDPKYWDYVTRLSKCKEKIKTECKNRSGVTRYGLSSTDTRWNVMWEGNIINKVPFNNKAEAEDALKNLIRTSATSIRHKNKFHTLGKGASAKNTAEEGKRVGVTFNQDYDGDEAMSDAPPYQQQPMHQQQLMHPRSPHMPVDLDDIEDL
jgi:hypothetical protein